MLQWLDQQLDKIKTRLGMSKPTPSTAGEQQGQGAGIVTGAPTTNNDPNSLLATGQTISGAQTATPQGVLENQPATPQTFEITMPPSSSEKNEVVPNQQPTDPTTESTQGVAGVSQPTQLPSATQASQPTQLPSATQTSQPTQSPQTSQASQPSTPQTQAPTTNEPPLFPAHVPPPTDLQPIITSNSFKDVSLQKVYQGPKPVALLILDGWGIGPNNAGNAIARAKTPNMDKYWLSYPHTQLAASGQAVGLPAGEDGNTETGHLNIGAGHIVYQDLPRINSSIADGSFYHNQALLNAINHAKENNSVLHLMGLIGAGGVHSNIEHLYALLNLCKQQELPNVYIHGFTDGRDSPPTSGINYVQQILDRCESLEIGKLATLMGRYYAMDRDKKWDRIEKAYNALVLGNAEVCVVDPIEAMQQQYNNKITDEFIEPINVCDQDGSKRLIENNDAVIFFNYRIDRPRELSRAFVMNDFESGITNLGFDPYSEKYKKTNIQKQELILTFQRQKVVQNLYFTTMTRYEETLPSDVAFPPQNIKNPLCKVIANKGLKQLRITETEKERFVTYYMNGQQDIYYPGEDRVIVPSKGVKSYDEVPEMSAPEVGREIINRVRLNTYDVIIANICNGDMVGHTGNLEATIRACEILDGVLGKIVDEITMRGGVVIVTADHGNAEELINNDTGEIDTEHSIYPVPLIIIGNQFRGQNITLPTGILADVAPTILKILGIDKPESMTGRVLI